MEMLPFDRMSIPVQRCYPEEYLEHDVADMHYGSNPIAIKMYSIRFRKDCDLEMFPNACMLLSFGLADDGQISIELIGRVTEYMAPRQRAGRIYTMLRFPPYFLFRALGDIQSGNVPLPPDLFGGEAAVRRAIMEPVASKRFEMLMLLIEKSGLGLHESPIVMQFLMQVLAGEPSDSIEQIIGKMNYSPRYVRSVIKQSTGVNAKRFSDIIRLQHMITMLILNDEDPVTCVFRNGFFDQTHMNKNLKKLTQCSYTSLKTILRRKNAVESRQRIRGREA